MTTTATAWKMPSSSFSPRNQRTAPTSIPWNQEEIEAQMSGTRKPSSEFSFGFLRRRSPSVVESRSAGGRHIRGRSCRPGIALYELARTLASAPCNPPAGRRLSESASNDARSIADSLCQIAPCRRGNAYKASGASCSVFTAHIRMHRSHVDKKRPVADP